MSGRQLGGALVAIAVLALLLPPLAARQVHKRRIAHAQAGVQRIAASLAADGGTTVAAIWTSVGGAGAVLAGPGAAPKFAPGTDWPEGRLGALGAAAPGLFPAAALVPDPWGNQYLVAVDAGVSGRVIVVSAGPNGIIETRFHTASRTDGDDVGTGR